MIAKEKQLLTTIAHLDMCKEQLLKELKMLQVETSTGAVSTAPRATRGMSVAEREKRIARATKRFMQNPENRPK